MTHGKTFSRLSVLICIIGIMIIQILGVNENPKLSTGLKS